MKLSAPRSNAADPRLARWLMALLLAILAFLSQRSVLSFGLTGADTPLLLAAASWSDRVVPPALLGPALGDPSLGIVFYRPLTALSYSLQLQTTGLDPLAFQLGNLLLHVGVVVLLFFAGRAWLSLFGAFFAAVVFALHPLLVEVVPDVSRRGDLLATLLVLATALSELRGHHRRALLFCAIAPLAKETGWCAVLVLGWLRVHHCRSGGDLWRRLAPLLVCSVPALLLRWVALGEAGGYAWRPPELRLVAHSIDALRFMLDPSGWLPIAVARVCALLTVLGASWLAASRPRSRGVLGLSSVVVLFMWMAMAWTGRWVRPHLYLPLASAALLLAAALETALKGGRRWLPAALWTSLGIGLALSSSPLWTRYAEWHAASWILRSLVPQAEAALRDGSRLRLLGLPDRILPEPGPGLRAHHVGVLTARGLEELLQLAGHATPTVEAMAYLNVPAREPGQGVEARVLDESRLEVAVEPPARLAFPPPMDRDRVGGRSAGESPVWWVPTPGLRYHWISVEGPHHAEFRAAPDSGWTRWRGVRIWTGRELRQPTSETG